MRHTSLQYELDVVWWFPVSATLIPKVSDLLTPATVIYDDVQLIFLHICFDQSALLYRV